MTNIHNLGADEVIPTGYIDEKVPSDTVVDDGLVHIEGQPDICFKLGHGERNMFTFQVYHKGQPILPIIPTTARFTVYNKTRNENIRDLLIENCGLSSDATKSILSKLDSSCGTFLETQEAKMKAIAEQKDEENRIKEETLAEEAKKPKTVTVSIDKNVFDGEKAELVCGFESNYHTCELFIDGKSWAGGKGDHII